MDCCGRKKGGICSKPSIEIISMCDNISEEEKYPAIIADFVTRMNAFHDSVEHIKSLNDAIEFAALATNSEGKRYPHQRRIKKDSLAALRDNLMKKFEDISLAKSFEELHTIVKEAKSYGIGELTIYDTAQRIGLYMNLFPNYVYMHAGTRVGAIRLIGKKGKEKFLDKNDFPEAFRSLSCAEIEDILCRYKDCL